MTSRRSRLKAVTNLPVRRKTLSLQGSAIEGSLVDNLSSEKVYSSDPKVDEAIAVSRSTEQTVVNDLNDSSDKNNENESIVLNCVGNFQNNSCYINEDVINANEESNHINIFENAISIRKAGDFISFKTHTCKGSTVFCNSPCFKTNLTSSPKSEKVEIKTSLKNQQKETLENENCFINNNNNKINNITNSNINDSYNDNANTNYSNNNFVEDGFKCYAVLTPQATVLSHLADYTITTLNPCENTYIDSTVSDANHLQEYEEVQIYSEIDSTELLMNNGVEVNSDSVIETESLQPVLTNLSNSNTSQEVNSINLESLNSHFTELKNASENLFSKARLKSQTLNIKTNFSGRNEYYNNSIPQRRDLQVLENTELFNVQNVSSDINCKQSISTIRRKRSKCNDFTKKLADAKREFQKKYEKTKPDRSTLKMIDLIFYNPSTNPMESKAKFEKKDTTSTSSDVISDLLAEERVDEPEPLDCNSQSNLSDNVETENLNKMPVPQVKIGLDGEIILDEKSLIIETTEAKKGREELYNSIPVFEDNGCKVSYYKGKSKKTRDWADFETKRFYKALNTIGPDFSLMQKYFPKRSRLELKNKFKREERLNRNLIDKALNNPSEFDMTQLEKDLAVEKEAEEEEVEMRLCKIIKQTAKRPKVKSSLLSREMIESEGEFENSLSKSFEANSKRFSESEKNKKEKEFDFVFQKLLMKESKGSRNKLPEISSSFPDTFKDSGHGVT